MNRCAHESLGLADEVAQRDLGPGLVDRLAGSAEVLEEGYPHFRGGEDDFDGQSSVGHLAQLGQLSVRLSGVRMFRVRRPEYTGRRRAITAAAL